MSKCHINCWLILYFEIIYHSLLYMWIIICIFVSLNDL